MANRYIYNGLAELYDYALAGGGMLYDFSPNTIGSMFTIENRYDPKNLRVTSKFINSPQKLNQITQGMLQALDELNATIAFKASIPSHANDILKIIEKVSFENGISISSSEGGFKGLFRDWYLSELDKIDPDGIASDGYLAYNTKAREKIAMLSEEIDEIKTGSAYRNGSPAVLEQLKTKQAQVQRMTKLVAENEKYAKYTNQVLELTSELEGLKKTDVHMTGESQTKIDKVIAAKTLELQDAIKKKDELVTEKTTRMQAVSDLQKRIKEATSVDAPAYKEFISYATDRYDRAIGALGERYASPQIVSDVITAEGIEFTKNEYANFADELAFRKAVDEVQDSKARMAIGKGYAKVVDSKNYPVYSKLEFLMDQDTYLGNGKKAFIPGIENIGTEEQPFSIDDAKHYFKEITTSEAAENVQAADGYTKKQLYGLGNIINGYLDEQNNMTLDEKAAYISKKRADIEKEALDAHKLKEEIKKKTEEAPRSITTPETSAAHFYKNNSNINLAERNASFLDEKFNGLEGKILDKKAKSSLQLRKATWGKFDIDINLEGLLLDTEATGAELPTIADPFTRDFSGQKILDRKNNINIGEASWGTFTSEEAGINVLKDNPQLNDPIISGYLNNGIIDSTYARELESKGAAAAKSTGEALESKGNQSIIRAAFDGQAYTEIENLKPLSASIGNGLKEYEENARNLANLEMHPNAPIDVASIKEAAEKYGPDFEYSTATEEQKLEIREMAKRQYVDRSNKGINNVAWTLKELEKSDKDLKQELLSDISNDEWQNDVTSKGFIDANNRTDRADYTTDMFEYNQQVTEKINGEYNQQQITQEVIDEAQDKVIVETRQRDMEFVEKAMGKTHNVVEVTSIGRSVTAEELANGYIERNGGKLPLAAVNEYRTLMPLREIRPYGIGETPFSMQEWLDKKIKFGDLEYDINQFEEYYMPEMRERQVANLRGIPGTPEVITKEKLKDRINSELQTYVETAAKSETVNYQVESSVIDSAGKQEVNPVIVKEVNDTVEEAKGFIRNIAVNPIYNEEHPELNDAMFYVAKDKTGKNKELYSRIHDVLKKASIAPSIDDETQSFLYETEKILKDASETKGDYGKVFFKPKDEKKYKQLLDVINYTKKPVNSAILDIHKVNGKTTTLSATVNVSQFSQTSIPKNVSQNSIGSLFARTAPDAKNMILGVDKNGKYIRGAITMDNYKKVFEYYGVDTSKVKNIERLIQIYNEPNLTAELSYADKRHFEDMLENARIKKAIDAETINAAEKGMTPPKNLVVIDKEADDRLVSMLEKAKLSKETVTEKGNIVPYKVLNVNNKYATLEAQHIKYNDIGINIRYTGKKTTLGLLEDLDELAIQKEEKLSYGIEDLISSVTEKTSAGFQNVEIKEAVMRLEANGEEVTEENAKRVLKEMQEAADSNSGLGKRLASMLGDEKEFARQWNQRLSTSQNNALLIAMGEDGTSRGILRSDILKRITSNNKSVQVGTGKTSQWIQMPKLLYQVTGANWSWMLSNPEIESYAYSSLVSAVNSIDSLDIALAAKDMEFTMSNLDAINENTLNSAIDRAISQKAKGNLIKTWMHDTRKNSMAPEIRASIKALEAQGLPVTTDNIRDTLLSIQKDVDGTDLSWFFRNISKFVNDKKAIATEMHLGTSEVSLNALTDEAIERHNLLDRLDDGYGVTESINEMKSKATFGDVERIASEAATPQNKRRIFAQKYRKAMNEKLSNSLDDFLEGTPSLKEGASKRLKKLKKARRLKQGRKAAKMTAGDVQSVIKEIVEQETQRASFNDIFGTALNKRKDIDAITQNVLKATAIKNKNGEIVAYNLKKLDKIFSKTLAHHILNGKAASNNVPAGLKFEILSEVYKKGSINDVLEGIAYIGMQGTPNTGVLNGSDTSILEEIIKKKMKKGVKSKDYNYVIAHIDELNNPKHVQKMMKVFDDIPEMEKIKKLKQIQNIMHMSPLRKGFLSLFGNNDPNVMLKGLGGRGLLANNEKTMDMFYMLQGLLGEENLKIQGAAITSNGNLVSFPYNKKYENTIVTNNGEAYRLVNDSVEAIDRKNLTTAAYRDFNVSRMSIADKQVSRSIIGPGGTLSVHADSALDYDAIAMRGKQNYGHVTPYSVLENWEKAIKNNDKILVYDLETTGLPGTIDDELFRPIQFSAKETHIGKRGLLLRNGKKTNYYFAPGKKILEQMKSPAITPRYSEYVKKLAAIAPDQATSFMKDDAMYGLYRNYAKYAKGGDVWLNDIRKTQAGTIEVLGKNNEVVRTFTSAGEYVSEMLADARDVVRSLEFRTQLPRTAIDINKAQILDFDEGVSKTISKLNGYIYNMGHNSNAADNEWLWNWGKTVKKASPQYDYLSFGYRKKAIDTLELLKMAYPGRENFKLENFMAQNAHFSNADVDATIELANTIIKSKKLEPYGARDITEIDINDIFVKTGVDDRGLQNLPKGMYIYKGLEKQATTVKLPNGGTRTIEYPSLRLENFFTNEQLRVPITSSAMLEREASRNWMPIGGTTEIDDAFEYMERAAATNTNRTAKDSYKWSTWMDHLSKGKGRTEQVIGALKSLSEELQPKVLEERANELCYGMLKMENWTDIQLIALANQDKLLGDGLTEEIRKVKQVRIDRIPEYGAFTEFAESNEGKLIAQYLYEGNLLERANGHGSKGYGINKAIYEQYNKNVYNIAKTVREEAIANGLLDAKMYMLEVPGMGKLETIKESQLKKLVPSLNVEGVGDIDINLSYLNRKSATASMKGNIRNIIKKLKAANPNLNLSNQSYYDIAVNDIIMPTLARSKKGTPIMSSQLEKAIRQNYKNRHLAPGVPFENVDVNMRNTLNEFMSQYAYYIKHNLGDENADKIFKDIVQEVDMYTPLEIGSDGETYILGELKKRLAANLEETKDAAATISKTQNGETIEVVDNNIRRMLEYTVEVKRQNDAAAIEAIEASTGIEDGRWVAAHLNIEPEMAITRETIKPTDVFKGIDTSGKHPEYATYSPMQLREKIDNMVRTTKIPEEEKLVNFLNISQNHGGMDAELAKKYPDFVTFVNQTRKGAWSEKGSNIEQINKNLVRNYRNARGASLIEKHIQENQRESVEMLKTLYDRAMAYDRNNPKVSGYISDVMYNSNIQKFESMEAIGLIQMHNGRRFTGKIGLAGNFKEGIELDPSKILIHTKSGSVGFLSDLTYDQLSIIKNDQYTNHKIKGIASRYINVLDRSFEQSAANAKTKEEAVKLINTAKQSYNEGASARYAAYKTIRLNKERELVTAETTEKDSIVKALNEKLVRESKEAKAAQEEAAKGASIIDDVATDTTQNIEDAKIVRELEDAADSFKNKSRNVLKDIMGNKVVKYSLFAAAGALALNAIGHYNSHGKTPEQMPGKDKTPMVDGNYEKEYNGDRHEEIKIPKTVRAEENGTGMNIKVNARNKQGIRREDITNAVNGTLHSTVNANVNFRYSDDTSTIDQNYVQGLFSNALQ